MFMNYSKSQFFFPFIYGTFSKGIYNTICKYIAIFQRFQFFFIFIKVLKALDENNIKVPDDISIIGFNDLIASQHTIPPLTTVRVHIENLASAAVDLIIERIIKGRKYCKKVVIPSELIIRKSSDIVKK